MPALIRRCSRIALLLALTAGCGSPPPEGESAESEAPVGLDVGRHTVRVVVPAGWRHYGHGDRHRFERGMAHVSLTDVGPVTRQAVRREIEASRDLFRRGQLDDAREALIRLELRCAFPTENQWKAFERSWYALRKLAKEEEIDLEEVERTYVEVLVQVDALPTHDLNSIAASALEELGHDAMRGVAEQRPLVVDGKDAVWIDTWDRLSHTMRKSHVVVLNEGNLLVARMELGSFDEMQPAFDTLVASLELPAAHESGS